MATHGRQRHRYRSLITTFIVLLLAGFFVQATIWHREGRQGTAADVAAFITSPFLRAGAAVHRQGETVWLSLFEAERLREENRVLREELASSHIEGALTNSRAALASLSQDVSTNIPKGSFELIAAPVLSAPTPGGRQALWLARGVEDGLSEGMVVLGPHGIVGIVDEVYEKTAVVLLLTDEKATWGAEVEGRGELGLLRGTGEPDKVEFLFNRTAITAEAGDPVVSTGMAGSLAPGGIPFGQIESVTYNKKGEPVALVHLPEEPGRLRTVFVMPVVRLSTETP